MQEIEPGIIKYPIITDKTTKSIENNIYYFRVTKQSNKKDIKKVIEKVFNVKVKRINTLKDPIKTKTIGRFKGKKTTYKRAVIELYKEYNINLFNEEDNT
uniref:Large ribosomal subunit protein uL23c n=1 Tax=Tolypiocladia glomerulata TaxID=860646 RepID=A0A1Z1MV93_9FLOR|nr:ribosomal protein L23 [Tolypiocladia glomerulata]ARW69781.1 ribosomal protein L23 [Tolypiocladia glomerulata]